MPIGLYYLWRIQVKGVILIANRGNKDKNPSVKNNDEGNYIFRPYITKNGKRIYAKSYGKKAFRIPIDK